MQKEYLISIVVPTKNRYNYLKSLILLIRGFHSEDIELVIQDNTEDNNEIVDFISNEGYEHLKYFHTIEKLSVSQNSDLAIQNSTGKYVCFIGDDDGITECLVDQVKYLDSLGLDAMITRLAIYNWPDFKDDSLFKLSATLSVVAPNRKDYVLNSEKELKKVVESGFESMGMLPKVYQGVVKRKALDKIYDRCGSFFPGPSPDMANAIALTCVISEYLYTDKPIIITGQSKFVGGGERLMTKLLRLSEIPHLPSDIMEYWDDKLPTFWCTDTIWPGSATIAAKKMGKTLKVDYNRIYGRFVFNHPSYYDVIKDFKHNAVLVNFYKWRVFLNKCQKWVINRITFYCSNKTRVSGSRLYRGLRTIIEASDILIHK